MVRVSALLALEGDPVWEEKIGVDGGGGCVGAGTDPELDKPFLMPIEDVFTITGRGRW